MLVLSFYIFNKCGDVVLALALHKHRLTLSWLACDCANFRYGTIASVEIMRIKFKEPQSIMMSGMIRASISCAVQSCMHGSTSQNV